MASRRIAIVGAGVVGAALADELVARGESDVTVLDRGPLFDTGGSSSHAPGLISRTSPSRFMTETADATIRKFASLGEGDDAALLPVGTLEVAYTDDRLRELWRRHDAARAFGWRGEIVEPEACVERWPILETDGLLGGYATADEGLAVALRAVEAQAARAAEGGARLVGGHEVTAIEESGGHVRGVRCADGDVVPADVVVLAAGVWTRRLAALAGLRVPVQAMEHQYAVTAPVPVLAANAEASATMPILRHHDAGIYYRDHGDRVGIGSFAHRGLPVGPDDLDDHPRNADRTLAYGFTEDDFADAWRRSVTLLPALDGLALERFFNGVFGFTPDGYPAIGEHPAVAGLWVAASVWVTHSVGVAQIVADILTGRDPAIDASPADLARFDDLELEPAFVEARGIDQYVDVYVAHHPAEPHGSARGLRWSPLAERERALEAVFVDVATWERPQWYGANGALLDSQDGPARDDWSARHWSPIAVAEHLAVRERAGLFDLTPLTRIEITGPGIEGFLAHVTAGRLDRGPGTVTYTVMLNRHGGVVSDVTLARFESDRVVLGGNGPRDLAWLRHHLPTDGSVRLEPVTSERTCLGLWGHAAREILQPITETDLSNAAFPYLAARRIQVAGVWVDAARISYAGELGWELSCGAAGGERLWDALWDAGRRFGLVAAGRAALGSLRLEKAYRAWGTDLTPQHSPVEAGLGFTVREGGGFVGAEALAARAPASHVLRTLVIDDEQTAMGGEPVVSGDDAIGFVTSAGYGASVATNLALAWLPADLGPNAWLSLLYLDRRLPARIADPDPPFDPEGARLRA